MSSEEQIRDKSKWFSAFCPCCGCPIWKRITNLQMVARTGDEKLAEAEYKPRLGDNQPKD